MGDFHSRPPAAAAVPISPSFRRQSILGHAHQIFSQEVVLVQLSWVQFSLPLWTEPATTGDGRRRFLTVKNRRRPSPVVATRRRFSSNDRHCIDWPRVCPDCEEPATTANFVAESSRIVAGSMHSGKLNWTEELSWVEFSFPLCIGLKSTATSCRIHVVADL